ncbi:MAG TPA: hypothetical protein VKA46_39675 [Gemmataceae bacterium]|nr:hypothetical protein [Gemmataceae bacterium]
MSEITLSLPDELMEQAQLWALRTGRPVADFLTETIRLSLNPLGTPLGDERPLRDWTDEEVLAAADSMMDPEDDRLLSELLSRQREGRLTQAERTELTSLMQMYQAGQLRKARAFSEAVRRRLRERPTP